MMYRELLFLEIRKITQNIMFRILIIFLVMIQGAALFGAYKEWKNTVGDISVYNQLANKMNGSLEWDIIDMSYINQETGEIIKPVNRFDENIENEWYKQYLYSASRYHSWSSYIEMLQIQKGIVNKNILTDELNRYHNVGAPQYVNCVGVNSFVQNITDIATAFLLSCILVLVFAPIYIRDKQNNMNIVISASKTGYRQNKIIKAIASYIIITLIVTLYYAGFIVGYFLLFNDFDSLKFPLNTVPVFSQTPYKITILGFLIKSYLRLLLGTCALTSMLLIVSEKCKNYVTAIVGGFFISLFPLLSPNFGILSKVAVLFPFISMQGYFSYNQYIGYNFWGFVVTYKDLSIVFLFALTLISFFTLQKRK
jgi:hypothetical protein